MQFQLKLCPFGESQLKNKCTAKLPFNLIPCWNFLSSEPSGEVGAFLEVHFQEQAAGTESQMARVVGWAVEDRDSAPSLLFLPVLLPPHILFLWQWLWFNGLHSIHSVHTEHPLESTYYLA
jgi:hypothetical protein